MNRIRLWPASVRVIFIFTLGFLFILAADLYPGLRGGAGWDWPYGLPQHWGGVAVLALLLIIYVVLALVIVRRSALRLALLWAVIGGTALAYGVAGVQGNPAFYLFTRTLSPVQTGASALAVRLMAEDGLDATLARWPTVMDEALDANLIHFTTSPPGQPILHYSLAKLFDSPSLEALSQPLSLPLRIFQCSDLQVMRYTRGEIISAGLVGLLMPLFAALAALPIAMIAYDLAYTKQSLQAAIWSALWWPLVPAVLMFAPTWNTLYPTLCVLAFALLLRGLLRRRMRYVFTSGLVMSVTTFLNFSVLPCLLLFGLFTLGFYLVSLQRTDLVETKDGSSLLLLRVLRAVIAGLWFGLGLLVVWILFFLATGLTPLDLLRVTFSAHGDLVQRDYLPWLILHPYDVLMFTGWPLVLLTMIGFASAVVWTARSIRRGTLVNARPYTVLSGTMLLTFLLVNLAGIVQGENARILMFYTPFLLICGLVLKFHPHGRRDFTMFIGFPALFAAQALTVLVMAAVLPVVPLDLNPQPTGPRQDIGGLGDGLPFIDSDAPFTSTKYAGAFALDQYRFIADPGAQAITFEFLWSGNTPTERPYQFEMVAHAENPTDGQITSEPFRWHAQGGNYLPTCWRDGDVIRDTVVLPLPPVSEPVVWDVTLRAVDERTGDLAGETILGPVRYP